MNNVNNFFSGNISSKKGIKRQICLKRGVTHWKVFILPKLKRTSNDKRHKVLHLRILFITEELYNCYCHVPRSLSLWIVGYKYSLARNMDIRKATRGTRMGLWCPLAALHKSPWQKHMNTFLWLYIVSAHRSMLSSGPRCTHIRCRARS